MPRGACRARARSIICRWRGCCGRRRTRRSARSSPATGTLYQRLVEPLLLAALNIDPPHGSAQLAAAVDPRDARRRRPRLPAADRPRRAWRDADRSGARASAAARRARCGFEHQLRALRFGGDARRGARFRRRHDRARRRRRRRPRGAALCRGARWSATSRRRPSSAPSSTRISASRRRPSSRRSSACSTARRNGSSPFPAGSRSRSAPPTAGRRAARGAREDDLGRGRAAVTGLPAELPPWQIVRERRATFAATPAQDAKRPGAADRLAQSAAGRRLDRYRPARHHRRRDPLRQPRRRTRSHRPREVNCNERTTSMQRHAISTARSTARPQALLARQRADGHWVFELEADATIPAEYVLLRALSRRAGRCRARSARSPSICAASRARTAAGRCSTTAIST